MNTKNQRATSPAQKITTDLGRVTVETKGDQGLISDFPVSQTRQNAGLTRD